MLLDQRSDRAFHRIEWPNDAAYQVFEGHSSDPARHPHDVELRPVLNDLPTIDAAEIDARHENLAPGPTGTPWNSARCVPCIVQRVATRSPSLMDDSMVICESGNAVVKYCMNPAHPALSSGPGVPDTWAG